MAIERQQVESLVIQGRIDEQGNVILPVIVFASDGLELEVEAIVRLEFAGAMAVHEDVAKRLGWRRLGSRRVALGFENRLMDHYIGTMALGDEPSQAVVLSGIKQSAIIGQKLLTGKKLMVDFANNAVIVEYVR